MKKIQFECSKETTRNYYFNITWGSDVNSYIEGVDDYAEIKIRADTEKEARTIFKKFIEAIKKRRTRLIN